MKNLPPASLRRYRRLGSWKHEFAHTKHIGGHGDSAARPAPDCGGRQLPELRRYSKPCEGFAGAPFKGSKEACDGRNALGKARARGGLLPDKRAGGRVFYGGLRAFRRQVHSPQLRLSGGALRRQRVHLWRLYKADKRRICEIFYQNKNIK